MSESSNVYRLVIPKPPRRGEYEVCPACGVDFMVDMAVCYNCGGNNFKKGFDTRMKNGRSFIVDISICAKESCPGSRQINPFKTVKKNCAVGRFCSPNVRFVIGETGWWFWKRLIFCTQDGVHLHQKCERCGWTGIVLPVGDQT